MGAIGEDELAKWEKMAGVGDEERILVSVRVRPLNSIEISRNDPVDWECINNTSIIHRNGISDRTLPPSTYSFGMYVSSSFLQSNLHVIHFLLLD